MMKAAMLPGAMIALSLVAPGVAEPRANERYCIEMAEQETLAQCVASKTAPNDRCTLNPILAFREREKVSANWRTRP